MDERVTMSTKRGSRSRAPSPKVAEGVAHCRDGQWSRSTRTGRRCGGRVKKRWSRLVRHGARR
eukprot:scaffold200563_cov39-Tisochrysis_lutea.AAC.3